MIMDRDTLLAILKRAVNAPSGENCQPWKFSWSDDSAMLSVYNVPERDQSLYNVGQNGSLLAHGALIENISLVAGTHGYSVGVTAKSDAQQPDLVATIEFKPESAQSDELASSIEKRCTNRKIYSPIQITSGELDNLKQSTENFPLIESKFIVDKEMIANLSKSMSMNERIVFEHQKIHYFFFSHIRWTKEEEAREKNGFFLPTLELDSKQQSAMKLFRSWRIVKIFNYIGVSKMIARDNEKHYRSSSLLGVITIEDNSKESLLSAGRAFQRIWLTVTKLGWSLQPATGIVLLKLAIDNGAGNEFSKKQQDMIHNAYKEFENGFQVNGNKIALMFRIGKGGEPSAYSQKMEPQISFL